MSSEDARSHLRRQVLVRPPRCRELFACSPVCDDQVLIASRLQHYYAIEDAVRLLIVIHPKYLGPGAI
jgi:hypothetical protein